ncbi:MAG TPA: COX15/CtaA family protein [Anaeromyxobacteraceae bacterium]|nr:COX15/CtaA family protein [Anaeromyxobacteraceae bacterium]
MKTLSRFTWFVLAYQLAVVAWGALVRATGSGAGCGAHWPLCNGAVVPRSAATATLIEFAHRATSGLALALVVAVAIGARRVLPRGHAARRAAAASLAFIVMEALLGAALVLFGWVAKDDSAARAWVMSLHLVNTFLLLAALALTAAWSGEAPAALAGPPGALPLWVGAALVALLLAGVSGAVAALGDTLFPATSFAEGLRQELAPGARVLLKLRVAHPVAALAAAGLAAAVAWLAPRLRPAPHVRAGATALLALLVLQLVAGAMNVLLLAPVWLQLVHLVLADLAWIAVVTVGAWTLAPGGVQVPLHAPRTAVAAAGP